MEEVENKIYNYIVNGRLEIEDIMKKYNSYIYTIINNSNTSLPSEDKEEIVLDVYLTLWNNQEKLDINKSMSLYLGGITRNLILKKCRNKKVICNIDDYENEIQDLKNIEIDYIESEKNKLIIDWLEHRKKEDKDIFIEYYYNQKRVKEIANTYGISESKVKSKLFRMRKRIRKVLKEGGYSINE